MFSFNSRPQQFCTQSSPKCWKPFQFLNAVANVPFSQLAKWNINYTHHQIDSLFPGPNARRLQNRESELPGLENKCPIWMGSHGANLATSLIMFKGGWENTGFLN